MDLPFYREYDLPWTNNSGQDRKFRRLLAIVMAATLFLEGGIRACEIGSVMFGRRGEDGDFVPATMELVRLALPRRCYTKSHIDRVLEIFEDVVAMRDRIGGLEMTERPPFLVHFTAKFAPRTELVPL